MKAKSVTKKQVHKKQFNMVVDQATEDNLRVILDAMPHFDKTGAVKQALYEMAGRIKKERGSDGD